MTGYKRKKTMKINRVFRLILIIVILIGVGGVGFYLFHLSSPNPAKPVNTTLSDKLFGWKFPVAKFPLTGSESLLAYSNIRDPGGVPQGLPVRLRIPVIGVDTAIEDALITPDGRMDVPAGSVNVAWFALGPHPGQTGSAVIGGHFGIDNGVPKVFYNLNKIKIGDKVYIVDDRGDTLAFIVRRTQSFDRNGDSTTVFTSSDGLAHLNIITCEGIWNQVNDSYPQRLVVFTDAIPAEGVVEAKVTTPVVAKTAQPKTTPKATATPISTPTIVPTPLVEVASSSAETKSVNLPTVLISAIYGLYDSPLDGLITSSLLCLIAFALFKVVRK